MGLEATSSSIDPDVDGPAGDLEIVGWRDLFLTLVFEDDFLRLQAEQAQHRPFERIPFLNRYRLVRLGGID